MLMRVIQGSRIVMFKITFYFHLLKKNNWKCLFIHLYVFIFFLIHFEGKFLKYLGSWRHTCGLWCFLFLSKQKSKSQSVFFRLCIVTQLVFHVIIAPPSLHICCLPFSLLISSRWMAQMKDLTSPQWSCCPEISLPYTMLFPSLCLK